MGSRSHSGSVRVRLPVEQSTARSPSAIRFGGNPSSRGACKRRERSHRRILARRNGRPGRSGRARAVLRSLSAVVLPGGASSGSNPAIASL